MRQAFHFQAQGHRLFGLLHQAQTPRALLLMCPPLLHEHVRSHRFFSHLADRFAAAGASCLRFDYYGTGDSAGADSDLSPETARDDIAAAAAELRARGGQSSSGGLPLVLMGVRASALLAASALQATHAQALWLWQPEDDGARYLARLETQDRQARSDHNRYPGRKMLPRPAPADELLGFKLGEDLRRFLCKARLDDLLDDLPPGLPLDVVATRVGSWPELPHALPHAARHVLADAAGDWAWEIDFPRVLHARDAGDTVDALLARLPMGGSLVRG